MQRQGHSTKSVFCAICFSEQLAKEEAARKSAEDGRLVAEKMAAANSARLLASEEAREREELRMRELEARVRELEVELARRVR